MNNYIVFLDQEHAKLFELLPDGVEAHKLQRQEIRHHSGVEKSQTAHKDGSKFFHEVATHLGKADQVLLVGPGLAKKSFQTHLEKHHHAELFKKVIGVQTVDHPTDEQLVALAKKFFKAHLRFE